MDPMVEQGDLVLYYRLDKSPSVGDVVVVNYEDHDTCMRVVAREGDIVDIDENGLVINGNHQYEEKIFHDTELVQDGVTFPIEVKPGEVFLLGDNRQYAHDSRMVGCVKTSELEGTVTAVLRRRGF